MTSAVQINLLLIAISLAWLVCVIICVLKAKYGMAIVGVVAAVAQEIGLPPIGGIYILNLIYPLWLVPFWGALRLAHPESYYAYWFYRRNLAKYFRAVQRFGMEEEYAELIAKNLGNEDGGILSKNLRAEKRGERDPERFGGQTRKMKKLIEGTAIIVFWESSRSCVSSS